MANVIGWIVLIPALVLFASLLVLALCLGMVLAGGPAPIAPWHW